MKLSALQKFILLQCVRKRHAVRKLDLLLFYARLKRKPSRKGQLDTLTKSIDNLISKELMIGYGEKTPHKWYINSIRLTPLGKKTAQKIIASRQKKLL